MFNSETNFTSLRKSALIRFIAAEKLCQMIMGMVAITNTIRGLQWSKTHPSIQSFSPSVSGHATPHVTGLCSHHFSTNAALFHPTPTSGSESREKRAHLTHVRANPRKSRLELKRITRCHLLCSLFIISFLYFRLSDSGFIGLGITLVTCRMLLCLLSLFLRLLRRFGDLGDGESVGLRTLERRLESSFSCCLLDILKRFMSCGNIRPKLQSQIISTIMAVSFWRSMSSNAMAMFISLCCITMTACPRAKVCLVKKGQHNGRSQLLPKHTRKVSLGSFNSFLCQIQRQCISAQILMQALQTKDMIPTSKLIILKKNIVKFSYP